MNAKSMLEIQALIFGYAERIDAGDFEGIGELFKYATILAGNGDEDSKEGMKIQGADAVTEMYKNSTRLYPADGTPKSKHVITNLIIEIADDDMTAKARSYYTVLQATDTLPLQPIITGRYHDLFERVKDDGNRWHFKQRTMITDQFGDLSQHLLFEIPKAKNK